MRVLWVIGVTSGSRALVCAAQLQSLLHLLLEELLDDVLGRGIETAVLPLGLLVLDPPLDLLLLHLLFLTLWAFEGSVAGHHLVDTAAQGPPVHGGPVRGLGQQLRGHVGSGTGLKRNNVS